MCRIEGLFRAAPTVRTMSSALDLPPLPTVGDRRLAVRLTKDALRQVRTGHPWIYDRSIESLSHDGAAGDLAVVFDDRRRFVAIGLFDPGSPIRIKVLHRGSPATIDAGWWRRRIDEALELRGELSADPTTTGYRIVNGESDGFPGFVVDRYAGTLVVKIYTAAWAPHLVAVLSELVAATEPEAVVVRTARNTSIAGLADGTVVLGGAELAPVHDRPDDVWFLEHGIRYISHPRRGQKTGFFLDQRDNRARLRARSAGATVLDVFSCTGGFSAAAAVGGAREVTSVDLAPNAIDTAGRVMAANAPKVPWNGVVGDAFDVLSRLGRERRRFAVVVVDPPSFAQRQANVDAGLRAYRRLTDLALPLVEPGGLLFQASCSSRISADAFFDAVTGAAASSSRRLVELERTGPAVDHPATFPQAEYLKALFARIE